MTTLYSCRHSGDQYRITKFDSDMNVESSYLCTATECECPAGVRPMCRHREMLPRFINRNAVGTEWFFDYDRGGWVQMGLDSTLADDPALPQPPAPESVGPHSEAVNAADFDSVGTGSNPVVATTMPAWRRF